MKKIKVTENELISLIEKIVNENLGSTPSLNAHGGGFSNLGMAKPTDKYKDLYEDDDIEEEMVSSSFNFFIIGLLFGILLLYYKYLLVD